MDSPFTDFDNGHDARKLESLAKKTNRSQWGTALMAVFNRLKCQKDHRDRLGEEESITNDIQRQISTGQRVTNSTGPKMLYKRLTKKDKIPKEHRHCREHLETTQERKPPIRSKVQPKEPKAGSTVSKPLKGLTHSTTSKVNSLQAAQGHH